MSETPENPVNRYRVNPKYFRRLWVVIFGLGSLVIVGMGLWFAFAIWRADRLHHLLFPPESLGTIVMLCGVLMMVDTIVIAHNWPRLTPQVTVIVWSSHIAALVISSAIVLFGIVADRGPYSIAPLMSIGLVLPALWLITTKSQLRIVKQIYQNSTIRDSASADTNVIPELPATGKVMNARLKLIASLCVGGLAVAFTGIGFAVVIGWLAKLNDSGFPWLALPLGLVTAVTGASLIVDGIVFAFQRTGTGRALVPTVWVGKIAALVISIAVVIISAVSSDGPAARVVITGFLLVIPLVMLVIAPSLVRSMRDALSNH